MAQTKIKAGLFEGIIGNGADGYFLMSNGDGTMTWSLIVINPTITSIAYPGSVTAADPAGGETITVTGTGFKTGATVTIGGTAAPAVSYVSETQITFTTPAKAAGDYDIVVTNTDTGSATYINGISYNGIPTWTTAAGSLGTFASNATISTITLQATEPDAGTITFSITNGALPTGLSLTGANINGTTTLETADTLYTFTVTATDDESQATPRTFTITVTKQFIGTENFTINTYTGTGSTLAIEGKIGTVASFNGSSSQIDLNYASLGMGVNNFSYSFWFKANNTTAVQALFQVLSEHVNYGMVINDPSGYLQSKPINSSGGTEYISASVTIDTDWHHVAYIKSSTTGVGHALYYDGTKIAEDTSFTGDLQTSTDNKTTLGSATNDVNWFNGKLDQVRFFNKALSSSEISTLAAESNASTTKSKTDIFNDGSGVALYEFEKGAKDTGGVSGYIGSGFRSSGESGDQYIDLPDALSRNQSQTLSAWVYPVTQSTDIGTAIKLSEDDNMVISYNTSGQFEIAGVRDSSDTYATFANVTKSANQWYHIVIARNASQIKLYIDGSLVETISWSGSLYSVGGQPYGNRIGQNNLASQSFTRKFAGRIDQVRIFNKELSSSEVTTLYGETSASATKSTTDIFDDGSGVALYELEGNANDSGRFGRGAIDGGQSAVFDGSSGYITINSTSTTPFDPSAENFTISAWINVLAFQSDACIISKWGSTAANQSYFFGFNGSADNTKLIVYEKYGSTTNIRTSTSTTITTGSWFHIAYVRNSTQTIIYINGVAETFSSTDTINSGNSQPIIVGRQDGYAGTSFNGKIDQLRIYSSALSASDIEVLISETNVPTTNLVAHYKLDGNANDSAGSNNGTATSITYSDPAEFPTYDGTATNVLYGYDGTPTNVSFVGTSFQPDLVWIKSRGSIRNHILSTSVQQQYNYLSTNLTDAEATSSARITSLDSNGFTIGTSANVNETNINFAAWCWKAGGTAVSNTDGSVASSVSANQAAGFSIVKYNSGTTAVTAGHGLNQKPEMLICKPLVAGSWGIWHKDFADLEQTYIPFTTSAAIDSGLNLWNYSNWGNNLIGSVNPTMFGNSNDVIAYCFHSVDGYQKVGSYTGTNATNAITTGFEPRFLMVKLTSAIDGQWVMYDNARSGSNPRTKKLAANSNIEENNSGSLGGDSVHQVNFTSTGFQLLETGGGVNTNKLNETYIYLAIA